MKPSSIASLVILVVLIGAGLAGYGYYLSQKTDLVLTETAQTGVDPARDPNNIRYTYRAVNANLLATNQHYKEGAALLEAGDYQRAIDHFRAALETATELKDIIKIKSSLALTLERSGQHLDAIAVFQDITATADEQTLRAHAYAIQQMAYIYYYNPTDTAIKRALFDNAELAPAYVEGDTLLTVRNLFELSITFWDLAGSEFQVANWYANHLLASYYAKDDAKLSVDTDQKYKDEIEKRFAAANFDLEYMRKNTELLYQLRDAVAQRALVYAKLGEAKLIPDQRVIDAFDASIAGYANVARGGDGNIRYYYAAFLAKAQGAASATRVREILAPVYTRPEYQGSVLENSMKNTAWGVARQAKSITALISLDPAFKTYLSGLGWTDKDFAAVAAK